MTEELSVDEFYLGRVDRCIYCGARDGLRDEHVIPFGLGGRSQLFNATCGLCADKTSAVERAVLQQQFLAFRTVLGLPTYHPKKRPTTLRARVERGGEWSYEDLPVEKFTAIAPFPKLPPPGVAEGRPEGGPISMTGGLAITVVRNDGSERNPARRAGADKIEVNTPIALVPFMRLLAKIGLGFSVARFGLDRLDPAVRGVILGTDSDIARWVGMPPPGWKQLAEHKSSEFVVRVRDIHGFVLAWIKLFGHQGGPEYMVIVGRLTQSAQHGAA